MLGASLAVLGGLPGVLGPSTLTCALPPSGAPQCGHSLWALPQSASHVSSRISLLAWDSWQEEEKPAIAVSVRLSAGGPGPPRSGGGRQHLLAVPVFGREVVPAALGATSCGSVLRPSSVASPEGVLLPGF